MALSAKEKELMLAEAQKNHAHAVKLLAEAADSIRTIYLLQGIELLADAILQAEREIFFAKATLTLSGDEVDYREKIESKSQILLNARQAELLESTKEQLSDRLVGLEIAKQVQNAWQCAVLEAALFRTLYDENRQRLFTSIDEMKNSVPQEVIEKLYEALIAFLEECTNAQVFLKPHTSKG